jgi:ELWxxDGT repeat protein
MWKGGSGSNSPTSLTAAGPLLFFSVNDGSHGAELWSSDGTQAGTQLVKDIYSTVTVFSEVAADTGARG